MLANLNLREVQRACSCADCGPCSETGHHLFDDVPVANRQSGSSRRTPSVRRRYWPAPGIFALVCCKQAAERAIMLAAIFGALFNFVDFMINPP